MKRLLLLTFTLVTLHAATPAVVNGLRINYDTSGTNTVGSSVTVSGRTNLNANVLTATNSVSVGKGGNAGSLTVNNPGGVARVTLSGQNGDITAHNSVKIEGLTANTPAVIGPDKTITNGIGNFNAAFDTVADMVASTITGVSGQVYVNRRSENVDNGVGGGAFIYDSTSADTTNLGTIFPSSSGVGRWIRQLNGNPVTFEMFDARGDGTTSDSVACNAALTYLRDAGGGTLALTHNYLVDDLVVYSNTLMDGGGKATLSVETSGHYALSINPGSGGTSDPADNQTNIVIRGIIFAGRSLDDGLSEHAHLLNINAATDVKIEDCHFLNGQGDGIYLGSGNAGGIERHNQNISIRNNTFDGTIKEGRNCISVIDCDGLIIQDNTMTRWATNNMPGGIDFEPDAAWNVVRNTQLLGNTIYDIGGNVGAVSIILYQNFTNELPQNFRLIGNTIYDCGTPAFALSQSAVTNSALGGWDLGTLLIGNNVTNCNRPFSLGGQKGVKLIGNRFIGCTQAAIVGYLAAYNACYDISLLDNYFRDVGFSVFAVTNMTISRNEFVDCVGNAIDFSTGTSAYISLTHNYVESPNGVTVTAFNKEAGHTFTPETNFEVGNVLNNAGGSSFQGYWKAAHLFDRDVGGITNVYFVIRNSTVNPTNSQGLELLYSDSTETATIQAYNRDTGQAKNVQIAANRLSLLSNTEINGNALTKLPSLVATNSIGILSGTVNRLVKFDGSLNLVPADIEDTDVITGGVNTGSGTVGVFNGVSSSNLVFNTLAGAAGITWSSNASVLTATLTKTNYTILAVSNPSTAVTTGVTNYWPLQHSITIKSVTARLLNPSSSGSVTMDLTKNGTTILSAPVSLSAGATNAAATLSVTTAAVGDALIGYVTAAGADAAGATLVIGYTEP